MIPPEGCHGFQFALESDKCFCPFFIIFVEIGHFIFGSKCFFQGQFPSSAQYMLCAQGMQINLMLALANPARKVNLIL